MFTTLICIICTTGIAFLCILLATDMKGTAAIHNTLNNNLAQWKQVAVKRCSHHIFTMMAINIIFLAPDNSIRSIIAIFGVLLGTVGMIMSIGFRSYLQSYASLK